MKAGGSALAGNGGRGANVFCHCFLKAVNVGAAGGNPFGFNGLGNVFKLVSLKVGNGKGNEFFTHFYHLLKD